MVEIIEIDDHISFLFAMNCSPNHKIEHCKRYRLVYLFHIALYIENVMIFIEYCFVAMAEKIETVRQFVILVTVNKRDFHYLFRQQINRFNILSDFWEFVADMLKNVYLRAVFCINVYIVGDDDIESGFQCSYIEGGFSRQLRLFEVFGNIQRARSNIYNRQKGETGDLWYGLFDSSPNK